MRFKPTYFCKFINKSSELIRNRYEFSNIGEKVLKEINLRKVLSKLSFWFILLLLSRKIISLVNFSNYGFDLTDQSLYLLEANFSSEHIGWGYGYGWFTGLIFTLSNLDIGTFRTNFWWITFLLNFWLVRRLIVIFLRRDSIVEKGLKKFTEISIIIIGNVSINFFLLSINRTPGYNMVNLIAIYLSVIGFTYLITNNGATKVSIVANSIISASYMIGITSKPSTPFFFFTTINLLSLLFFSKTKIIRNIALQITGFILLSTALIISGKIPQDIYYQIYSKLRLPSITGESRFSESVISLFTWPYRLLTDVLHINKLALLFLICSLYLLSKHRTSPRYIFISIILFTVYLVLNLTFKPHLSIYFEIQFDRLQHALTFLSWSSFLAYLVLLIILNNKSSQNINVPRVKSDYELEAVMTLFFVSFLAFGFGSSNGLIIMGVMCIQFLIYICLLLVLKFDNLALRRTLLSVMLFVVVYGSSLDFMARKMEDYRGNFFSSGKLEDYKNTFVSPYQKNKLNVSANLKIQIEKIHQEVISINSFTPGNSLINIVYPWAPGYSIILGATNPPTNLFTIFGHINSLELMDKLMKSTNKEYDYDNAFILKSNYVGLASKGVKQSESALRLIESRTKRIFPDHYELIYRDNLLELYKPKQVLK
jgi:hypothetical protein